MTKKLLAVASEHGPDGLMLAGGASLSWGAGMVYMPAGFMVAGMLLIVAGVIGARK